MNTLRIASATEADIPEILALIQGLAVYERLEGLMAATKENLREALFGEHPTAEVVLAFAGGECAGFAMYFPTFCAMLGQSGMFLENIFVKPEWRSMGVGEALLGRLAVVAEERGYVRIDWRCLVSNEPAIGFYKSQGAVALSDWTGFRMGAAAIHDLSRKTLAKELPTSLYERPVECRAQHFSDSSPINPRGHFFAPADSYRE